MSSLATPVLSLADDRHVAAMMDVMAASFDPSWGEAWTASQLASGLLLEGTFARRIVTEADQALGFTLCRGVAGEVELLLIAVRPACRGHGLGRALLAQVMADSRLRGMREIFLEVRESNTAALKLYRSTGFVAVGRRRDYYMGGNGDRHAAITMRCTVAELE
ncbi:ribosomal protein S18-alanine N-acetyltransferase [Blastomonas fulva]|uniref:ribosomal protein S18-alanine N-acetyltransferase n=1 Tax=Blastomonas fulva TaxID=1550728 RepID=UPI003F730DAF